jgi:hypothetical protein
MEEPNDVAPTALPRSRSYHGARFVAAHLSHAVSMPCRQWNPALTNEASESIRKARGSYGQLEGFASNGRMRGTPYRGSMPCHAAICEPEHALAIRYNHTGHLRTSGALTSRMHPMYAAWRARCYGMMRVNFSERKMPSAASYSKDADQGHPRQPSTSWIRRASPQRAPGASPARPEAAPGAR